MVTVKRRQIFNPATLYLLLQIFLIPVHADNDRTYDILTIDKPPVSHDDLYFPDTDDVHPDDSDFKILSSILLSSTSGQRSATVTFKNLSSGQRILNHKQVLAIFANGQKRSPLSFKQKFSGNQKITLNLNFGISTYPILSVYTNN